MDGLCETSSGCGKATELLNVTACVLGANPRRSFVFSDPYAPHHCDPAAERGRGPDPRRGPVLHARLQHRVALGRPDRRSDGLASHAGHQWLGRGHPADRQPAEQARRRGESARHDPRPAPRAGAGAAQAARRARRYRYGPRARGTQRRPGARPRDRGLHRRADRERGRSERLHGGTGPRGRRRRRLKAPARSSQWCAAPRGRGAHRPRG